MLALADFYEDHDEKIKAAKIRQKAGISMCRFEIHFKGRLIETRENLGTAKGRVNSLVYYHSRGYRRIGTSKLGQKEDYKIVFVEYVKSQTIDIPLN